MLEREPFGQLDSCFHVTHFELGRGGAGLFPDQYDERFHKRAKVDDLGLASFTQIPPPHLPIHNDCGSNVVRISSENKRRLDLIRDHGAQTKPLPQVGIGVGSTFDSGRDFGTAGLGNQGSVDSTQRFEYDHQTDRFSHGSLLQERRFNDFDAGERTSLEESDGRTNSVPNSLNCSGSSSVGRQGAVLLPDPLAFNQRNHSMQMNVYGEDHDFPGAPYSQNIDGVAPHEHGGDYKIGSEQQQQMRTYNRDRFPSDMDYAFRNREGANMGALYNSQHDNVNRGHHARSYRPGDIGTGAPNYVESVHQSGHDLAANLREDYGAQGSHEYYCAYDQPPFPSKDFSSSIPGKQLQYPHTATWQAPNVQQQEQRSSHRPLESRLPNILPPQPVYPMQNHLESKHEFYDHQNDVATPFDRKALPLENIQRPVEPEQFDARNTDREGYSFVPAGSSITSSMPENGQPSQAYSVHPHFTPLPPQPTSMEQPGPSPSHFQPASLPSTTCHPLYPVPLSSSTTVPSSFPPATQGFPDVQSSSHAYFNKPIAHVSSGFATDVCVLTIHNSFFPYFDIAKRFGRFMYYEYLHLCCFEFFGMSKMVTSTY